MRKARSLLTSLCPSVRHVGGLYTHGWRYRQISCSARYITLVFWHHAPIPNSKENPFSVGAKYTGVGKLAIFDWNSRLSRKGCDRSQWLLQNVSRKSSVADDLEWPWPRYFHIEYHRNDMRYSHSFYGTSTGSRMRSIEWGHFQYPRRTPNPVFKVTAFFKTIISKRCVLGIKIYIEHW